ncbi:hypothetical protein [Cellulosimicrobium sp. Marseille-Q4280]|uniref:hypothetical protein n=1 Tax=Cellulosimicrobium sp. Marseille-Q4280 TaxID=2937992 RepID=UPI00203AB2F8|nr:hypothetical protein [Cellulosimicrobium sp. Marseille-Q4280]
MPLLAVAVYVLVALIRSPGVDPLSTDFLEALAVPARDVSVSFVDVAIKIAVVSLLGVGGVEIAAHAVGRKVRAGTTDPTKESWALAIEDLSRLGLSFACWLLVAVLVIFGLLSAREPSQWPVTVAALIFAVAVSIIVIQPDEPHPDLDRHRHQLRVDQGQRRRAARIRLARTSARGRVGLDAAVLVVLVAGSDAWLTLESRFLAVNLLTVLDLGVLMSASLGVAAAVLLGHRLLGLVVTSGVAVLFIVVLISEVNGMGGWAIVIVRAFVWGSLAAASYGLGPGRALARLGIDLYHRKNPHDPYDWPGSYAVGKSSPRVTRRRSPPRRRPSRRAPR